MLAQIADLRPNVPAPFCLPSYVVDWRRRPRTQKNPRPSTAPFRGQILSRPRTKNTGANILQKKVFKFFFQTISKRGKQKTSSQIFCEVSGVFLHNSKNEQIPTIVGTDAHRTIWGSSDTKPRRPEFL